MESNLPLNTCHIQKSSAIVNRCHAFIHFTALVALIYYRASFLFHGSTHRSLPTLIPWLLVFASELILSFIWLLGQASRWRPVSRAVYPERLPEDEELPAIDVFVCTADPMKEPAVAVMNTVISAMAMDYPPEKVHVYLSDDGGCDLTLHAMKEAWRFARHWLPFCRAYRVKTRCPEAYFLGGDDDEGSFNSSEFMAEKKRVKEKYEDFKESVTRFGKKASTMIDQDHPTVVEEESMDADAAEMPLLIYVSREKTPSIPHHFKGGALNVLLRVSALISNSPYILMLDCDMYCNDPTSTRQAMCFHLDPKLSPSLAFVQFPQTFHNISKTDIYGSELRSAYKVQWPGMDGLEGPCLSGTGFYIKRESLYGNPVKQGVDVMELKQSFGSSNEFIKSLGQHYRPNHKGSPSVALLKEAKFVASSAYEDQTKWGKKAGFLYFSVAEDFFTGIVSLPGKGWISVYFYPARPAYLGTGTTTLNDVLVQGTRWGCGLVEVGLCRFSPLVYGLRNMSILQALSYAELALFPFYFLPVFCFGTIPQFCLLNGISLYPEVSSRFFFLFLFIFLSSLAKNLEENFSTGGSLETWRNEQRMWMIKSVSCHLYGSLDAIMKKIGLRKASFLATNKVVDEEHLKLYQIGKFDFQTSPKLLVPMVALVILNLVSLVGGVARVFITGNFDKLLLQLMLSAFVMAMSFPIVEGMVLRKDKGRIPNSVSMFSALVSASFLCLGSLVLRYM
ncbi:Cellulose synthase (UDP-forming) [Bertholletia excelsa]